MYKHLKLNTECKGTGGSCWKYNAEHNERKKEMKILRIRILPFPLVMLHGARKLKYAICTAGLPIFRVFLAFCFL